MHFVAFLQTPLPSVGRQKSIRRYTTHESLVPVASASISNDTSFSQWATSVNIRMPSLVLSTFPNAPSRGLAATQPIPKNSTLVSVPSRAALQVTTTADERIPTDQFPIPRPVWRKLPWYARLALLVIAAAATDGHSLHQWAKRLPSAVDAPHHWGDAELAQLHDHRMINLIREQRRAYSTAYNRICAAVPNVDLSFDKFIWAVDCVRSRAFAGPLEVAPFRERLRLTAFVAANTVLWPWLHVIPWENALNGCLTAMFSLVAFDVILPRAQQVIGGVPLRRYAIVPGIDMLNHNSIEAGDAQVEFQYFRESFEVRSGGAYTAGDQVYISYGKQSNDAFLQYYGFVEEGNRADTFVFDRAIAQELGVGDNELVATEDGFQPAVVKAVQKRIGVDRERAVTLLRETCRAQLERFETSMEEDRDLLGKGRKGDRRLMVAVQYRMEKKRVLRRVVDEWNGK